MKETQITDPNQWPGFTLHSYTTRLPVKAVLTDLHYKKYLNLLINVLAALKNATL